MTKKSLQTIEDFYRNQGYRGDRLRRVLKKDKEYKRILSDRRRRLSIELKITPSEKRRYVLSTDEDLEILGVIKYLERRNISKEDQELLKLFRTQLEHEWRKPLLHKLNTLVKKY